VRRWRSSLWSPAAWREIGDFRAALAAERYDLVIDTQGLLKSALICAIAPGVRHGMDNESAREAVAARFYDERHHVPRGLHAVERNRLLTAKALGFSAQTDPIYGLHVNPSYSEKPYAVLLTMTSRADKLWPEASWIELARALGMRVVLPWGSELERERAVRIAEALADGVIAEAMTLEALASLFAASRFVIGLDTGLTHLAAAVGARTVGIYAGSDPALTGLYGAPRAANVGGPGRPPSVAEVLKALG